MCVWLYNGTVLEKKPLSVILMCNIYTMLHALVSCIINNLLTLYVCALCDDSVRWRKTPVVITR